MRRSHQDGGTPTARPVLYWPVSGVLRLAYRTAGRHLVDLLVPAVFVLLPVAVVCGLSLAAVVRDGVVITGDGLVVPVAMSPWDVALMAVGGAVVFLAYVPVLAATVLTIAGRLAGRRVAGSSALRTVARRPGRLAVSAALILVLAGPAAAVAVVVQVRAGSPGASVAAGAVVAAVGWRFVLVLPVMVLEDVGVRRAVGRVRAMEAPIRDTFLLVVGLLLVPGLAVAGPVWVASRGGVVAGSIVLGAVCLVVVPFQAATLTVAALNRPRAAVVALPGPPGGRRRWTAPAVLAALPLPGLLFTGYVALNPAHLPVDRVMASGFPNRPVTLHVLPDGRAMEISRGGFELTARVCTTPACDRNRPYTHAIGDSDEYQDDGSMATAMLPGGTVAAAAWTPRRLEEDEQNPMALRVLTCGPYDCSRTRGAPVIAYGGYGADGHSVAIARSGRGLVIAAAHPARDDWRVRLIRCPDAACRTRHAVTLARVPFRDGDTDAPLAMATGPGGRPVIAYRDPSSGAITMIACDTATCRHPRRARPVPPQGTFPAIAEVYGVRVAVPPDGRPVLTYRDGRTGRTRLSRCRTLACTHADTVTLTGPARSGLPALTLDRTGRPLVAAYDRGTVTLTTCRDAACTHRGRSTLGALTHAPGALDVADSPTGRPVVLWTDQPRDFDGDGPLHLTSVRDPAYGR